MDNLKGAAARLREKQRPGGSSTAPPENGTRLATIRRRDGDELRVIWSEYQGHHFVNVRIWTQGDDGQWWPVKGMGLTVRLAELADFAEGIGAAVELAAQEMTGNDSTRPPVSPQDGHQAPLDSQGPGDGQRAPTGRIVVPIDALDDALDGLPF